MPESTAKPKVGSDAGELGGARMAATMADIADGESMLRAATSRGGRPSVGFIPNLPFELGAGLWLSFEFTRSESEDFTRLLEWQEVWAP